MGKLNEQILQLLRETGPLTLTEISEKMNKNPKVVFGSLRKLFENGELDCDIKTRRYYVAKKE